MKAARIDVPGIALIADGLAALMAGRQPQTSAPARRTGALSLALRIADGSQKTEDKTERRGGGINAVRFVATTTTTPK